MSLQFPARLPTMRQLSSRFGASGLVAVVIWLAACLGGTICLTSYAGKPGRQTELASIWPATSQVHRDPGRATLILFIHPRCPCSGASLRELDRLLAASRGAFDTTVVIVEPPDAGADWDHIDIRQFASALPGVHVIVDRKGQETRRFGVHTSGEAALYDASARLVFHGGITPARGHEGDSAGRDAILRWLQHLPAEKCSPVFGCPLLASTDSSADK